MRPSSETPDGTLFAVPATRPPAEARPRPQRDPEALLTGLNGPQRDAVTHAGSATETVHDVRSPE